MFDLSYAFVNKISTVIVAFASFHAMAVLASQLSYAGVGLSFLLFNSARYFHYYDSINYSSVSSYIG